MVEDTREQDTGRLDPPCRTLCDVSWPLAGDGDGRGSAQLSGPTEDQRRVAAKHEQFDRRVQLVIFQYGLAIPITDGRHNWGTYFRAVRCDPTAKEPTDSVWRSAK